MLFLSREALYSIEVDLDIVSGPPQFRQDKILNKAVKNASHCTLD